MGGWINWFTDQDRNPAFDLPDVEKDIPYIGALGRRAGAMALVPERLRPRADRRGQRSLAPELRQPPQRRAIFRLYRQQSGRADQPARRRRLLLRPGKNALPRTGGVFYIRGGYYNLNYPNRPPSSRTRTTPTKMASRRRKSPRSDVRSPATTIIRAIPTASSPKPWLRASSTRSPPTRTSGSTAPSSSPTTNPTASTTTSRREILSYGPDGLPLARGVRIPLAHLALCARPRGVARRGRPQCGDRDDQRALRPAGSFEPAGRRGGACAGNSPKFNAFAPPGFEQKYLGPRDAEIANDREPAVRLRQGAAHRRAAAAAGLLRDDPGRRHQLVSALRRQRAAQRSGSRRKTCARGSRT